MDSLGEDNMARQQHGDLGKPCRHSTRAFPLPFWVCMNSARKIKGFTLLEVLCAMTIGLVVLGAMYAVVDSGQRSSVSIDRKIGAQQDTRAALQIMAVEIGMASYNSNFASGLWLNTACGNNPPANLSYRGIQEATANSIIVEMDVDESSTLGDYPNEIIGFGYDLANQYITRNTNCQGAQPFLGDDPASGRPRTLRVINDLNGNGVYDDGIEVPIFTYYDGTGNQIPFANLPGRIPDIRRIDITLQVETDAIAPDIGQRRRMIYATSVLPMNHGISQ